MSSPNHSTCLIDLSGSNESPTSNTTPLMSFPPISADEMIVPLKRFSISNDRFSLSNDPFDTIEKQAKLFGDPFEIVNISGHKEVNKVVVPTARLVDVNGSGNSIMLSPDSQNNSPGTLNKGMCTVSSTASNSSLVDVNSSDAMNQAFVKSDSSIQVSNYTNRSRIQSDPVKSKLSKSKRKIGSGKTRSLEQVCLKNQLLKSLTNSPVGSPNWSKTNHPAVSLDSSLVQKKSNTADFNLTSESIFDDLLSTNPEWIESDNDDSDFERMTIPFLKNIQDNESTIPLTDCSSDRSSAIEKLSKFRKTSESVSDAVESANTTEDKLDNKQVDDISRPVDNITSIIETLRHAVENCVDAKKKSEASALLDNLNVCLKTAPTNTLSTNSPPVQFIRQRTFSVDDQLDLGTTKSSPIQVAKELSNSMPVAFAATLKSMNGTASVTPRRFSRSLSYAGKPVSAVSAVQIQSEASERRRSSVCTTPTRLIRQTSTSNPKSTRTSLSRQSLLSSSQDEKTVVKPVQRKTIMKTSNPMPANTATRPLKLRVGEQSKPSGPLKAVIPYQRPTTLPNNSEASTKGKRIVKTSTPLAPSNISKSGIPAASSTPVINTTKPTSLSHFRHSQSRLSYTPSTPLAKPLVRQPSSERKKRSVTFSEESDQLSRSMIIGAKTSTFQPMYPLQRRRLSQSYGINKENSILQKK